MFLDFHQNTLNIDFCILSDIFNYEDNDNYGGVTIVYKKV